MATIYRCDKCHAESQQEDHITGIMIHELTYHHVFRRNNVESEDPEDTRIMKRYDLCARCVGRLLEWIKPDAKELRIDPAPVAQFADALTDQDLVKDENEF